MHDSRGKLMKLPVFLNEAVFPTGIQDEYIAYSKKNVFRGFHRQVPPKDGNKVFIVLVGEIELYTLDSSKVSGELYEAKRHKLWENGHAAVVPSNFYTGYLVTSEDAIVQVKSSVAYSKDSQRVISPRKVWGNDMTLGWILSEQDSG
jgi:dTDP-4-dehydrorhamnose 3,5-epimerase-like enzyme